MKNLSLILTLLLCSNFVLGQDEAQEKIYKKNNLEVSLSYNQNFTFSTGRAINFWAFYDYNEEDYWQYNVYYPLLEYLNKDTSKWNLKPNISLNIKLIHFMFYSDFGIGVNYSIFKSKIHSVSTSYNYAIAKLYVDGYEYRMNFSPSIGYRINKMYAYVNLNFSSGFAKEFSTYLLIDEGNKTTSFDNDHDELFINKDFTLGLGFGYTYMIKPNIHIGFMYNNYKVNVSEYTGPTLFEFPNAYWNHSASVSLGYSF